MSKYRIQKRERENGEMIFGRGRKRRKRRGRRTYDRPARHGRLDGVIVDTRLEGRQLTTILREYEKVKEVAEEEEEREGVRQGKM